MTNIWDMIYLNVCFIANSVKINSMPKDCVLSTYSATFVLYKLHWAGNTLSNKVLTYKRELGLADLNYLDETCVKNMLNVLKHNLRISQCHIKKFGKSKYNTFSCLEKFIYWSVKQVYLNFPQKQFPKGQWVKNGKTKDFQGIPSAASFLFIK